MFADLVASWKAIHAVSAVQLCVAVCMRADQQWLSSMLPQL